MVNEMSKKSLNSLIYTNKEILHVKNRHIEEFDIEEAGWSISKELELLPHEFVTKLSQLNKKLRHIEIGLYSRDNPEFVKRLNEGFKYFTSLFRSENNILDEKVLSIKKDSLMLLDTNVSKTTFGEVKFTQRKLFSSYALINGIELYCNTTTGETLFKNINENFGKDDLIEETFILMKESEFTNKTRAFVYLKELRDLYLNKDLSMSFYRELNATALFRLLVSDSINNFYAENDDECFLEEVDISYNYRNFFLPMVNIFS